MEEQVKYYKYIHNNKIEYIKSFVKDGQSISVVIQPDSGTIEVLNAVYPVNVSAPEMLIGISKSEFYFRISIVIKLSLFLEINQFKDI